MSRITIADGHQGPPSLRHVARRRRRQVGDRLVPCIHRSFCLLNCSKQLPNVHRGIEGRWQGETALGTGEPRVGGVHTRGEKHESTQSDGEGMEKNGARTQNIAHAVRFKKKEDKKTRRRGDYRGGSCRVRALVPIQVCECDPGHGARHACFTAHRWLTRPRPGRQSCSATWSCAARGQSPVHDNQ